MDVDGLKSELVYFVFAWCYFHVGGKGVMYFVIVN